MSKAKLIEAIKEEVAFEVTSLKDFLSQEPSQVPEGYQVVNCREFGKRFMVICAPKAKWVAEQIKNILGVEKGKFKIPLIGWDEDGVEVTCDFVFKLRGFTLAYLSGKTLKEYRPQEKKPIVVEVTTGLHAPQDGEKFLPFFKEFVRRFEASDLVVLTTETNKRKAYQCLKTPVWLFNSF